MNGDEPSKIPERASLDVMAPFVLLNNFPFEMGVEGFPPGLGERPKLDLRNQITGGWGER